MQFHPLSELFPLMQGREFDELVADVKANGLREPIWTYEGQILDGRNRWRACEAAQLAHRPMREYTGEDPVSFVVSLNLHRRHLDESQRQVVAWQRHGSEWRANFRQCDAKNRGYVTVSCAVPVAVLFKAMGECLRVSFTAQENAA